MVKEYGYEYDAVLDEAIYERTKGKVAHDRMKGALCMRSGRDALKVVAREFDPTKVILPALACDSMVLPFTMYGHDVQYYRLNEDYSINLESLYSALQDEHDTLLFLYMDYFGNRAIADVELEKLKAYNPNIVFIEDRTHNLLVESRYSYRPDFVVASLRKWIDIPDGGLLWTERGLEKTDYCVDLTFSETRLNAQCMRHEFLLCGDEKIKTQYRRIFSSVTDVIDEDKLPGLMSQYSYEKAVQTDLSEVNETRRRNAQILIDELKGFVFIQNKAGYGDVYVSVLINNRDEVQKKLASMGVFCTIIWPLSDEQRNACDVAKYTEEHMLTIYCDQRYNVDDMRYVASCIRRVCND